MKQEKITRNLRQYLSLRSTLVVSQSAVEASSAAYTKYVSNKAKQQCRITNKGQVKDLSGDNSTVAPPDPIPNSEVKRSSADGSVGDPM